MIPAASSLELDCRPGKPPLLHVETGAGAVEWTAEYREALRAAVLTHGSLLVRGLRLRDAQEAEAVFSQLGSLMVETEAFAPRRRYAHGVYSSTLWPACEPICMHHELSYALQVPGLMLFACLTPPSSGGATLLADSSAVLRALPTDLVRKFEQTGWQLTRNYVEGVGISLAEAFRSCDRCAIEEYCRANAIAFEWQPDGGLRTRQRRRAILHHPHTRQACWFNQIAFLHDSTMDPGVREYLTDVYGPDALPFTTRFGNGDPIPQQVVQAIAEVYEIHTLREPWQPGDLMLVDNIRTAHAREPFAGPRDIVVALADPIDLEDRFPTFAPAPGGRGDA